MNISNFDNSKDYDPFRFKCNNCDKSQIFTEEEIEKIKQKTPGTDDEYFILCHFCKKGYMEPPIFIMTSGIFDEI